jgi:hypothetical protein
MRRTHQMASNRSWTAGATSIDTLADRRSTRPRRIVRRALLTLPAVLALMVPVAPGLAQASTGASTTGTSGYKQKPPAPKTTTEPKKEVEPSKEATTPTPTATTAPTTKASTLPFTGLNLTWVVGAGLLLLAAGCSIRLAQRTRAGR